MVDDFDKAIISLGVLVGAALISVIVAKLVDICYDRASISDDASDVSEHTRNLIRARLTVMKFRSKKTEKIEKSPAEAEAEKQKNAVKVLRLWSAKSRMRKLSARPPDVEAGKTSDDNQTKAEPEDNSNADTAKSGPAGVEPDSKGTDPTTKSDQKTIHSILKMPTFVTVDETMKREDVKMPKSVLVKSRPKSALATTTNTAGKTTALNAETPRPKSGVKRVTIAEPNGKSADSVSSLARSTTAVKVTLEDTEEEDHRQAETPGVKGEGKANSAEKTIVQPTERPRTQEDNEEIKPTNDQSDEKPASKTEGKTTDKEIRKIGNENGEKLIERADENGQITGETDGTNYDRTDETKEDKIDDETADKEDDQSAHRTDENETNRMDGKTTGKTDETDEKTTGEMDGKTVDRRDDNDSIEHGDGKSVGKGVGKSEGRKNDKPRAKRPEKSTTGTRIRGKSVDKAEVKPAAKATQKSKRKSKAGKKTPGLRRFNSDDDLFVPFTTGKKTKVEERPPYVKDESDSSDEYEFLSESKSQKK